MAQKGLYCFFHTRKKYFFFLCTFLFFALLTTRSFAQGPQISYTPLTNTCVEGNRTLTVTITDPDGVPTSGIGLPVLYWQINTQGFNAVQAVSLGSNQFQFTFGAGAFGGSVVYYYIVARDNATTPNISVFPGAGASGFSPNPPAAAVPPNTPDFFLIQNTLASGNYIVGATGTYLTLTDAINAYNSSCLNGPVTFLLDDASYGPSESFPILINNPQASAVNTLTIKPNTARAPVITGNSPEALIKFNGADFVTIDGSNNGTTSRNLTFTNNNTANTATVLWLSSFSVTNGATNNVVRNCIINGSSSAATIAGIVSSGNLNINTIADAPNSNNSFINNNISGVNIGMLLNGATTGDAANTISQNFIGSTTVARKLGYRGIVVNNQNNINITSNTIAGVVSSFYSGAEPDASAGIVISGSCTGGQASQNTIFDIRNTNTAGAPSYGLVLQTSNTASGFSVVNNFIHTVTGYGKSIPAENGIGIAVISGGGYSILFNSIHMGVNQNTAGLTSCLYFGPNISGLSDIRNNIFSNRITQGTRYAVYSAYASPFYSNINFNDYFSTGAVGYFQENLVTLVSWQLATLQDASSVATNPIFVDAVNANPALVNLHLQNASPLNNQGTAIAGITIDIDLQTRATPPDIGADDFTPPACAGNLGGTALSTVNAVLCVSGFVVLSCTGFSTGNGMAYQWEQSIDNTTWTSVSGETNPANMNTPVLTQSTYFRLRAVCAAGVAGYSNTVLVTVKNPQITSSAGANRCGTGSLTLNATANAGTTIQWYTAATGGAPIATGNTYTTPVLSATTTYYAEPTFIGSTGNCGPVSPSSIGTGISAQLSPWKVFFDVTQATTLASVDVFPLMAGQAFTIDLYNSSDQLIGSVPFTTTVSGGATAQAVPLNFFMLPDAGYYLYIRTDESQSLGNDGLMRNTAGAVYPYTSSDIVITGNEFTATYFMCFYNWKFTSGCSVPRVPITASIGVPADFALNGVTSICRGASTNLTASSINTNYTYTWSPGALTGSTVSVTPTADTRYTVTAVEGNCVNVKTIDVSVNDAPSAVNITNNAPAALCNGTVVTLNASGGTIPSLVTILNEKFEAPGIPLGWDTTNQFPQAAYTIAGKWAQRSSGYSTSGFSFRSNDTSKFFMANSAGTGNSNLNTALRSPRMDFTGYDSVSLTYWQYYLPWLAPDSISVEIYKGGTSINSTSGAGNGLTGWLSIYKAGPSTSGGTSISNPIGTNIGFVQKSINLTPYLNLRPADTRDTLYFRFRYVGKGGYWWAIDNVKIVGRGGSPITWTPVTGLFDNAACTNPYSGVVFSPTVYTKPTGPVTYTAISGTPNGCSSAASVTLNPRTAVTSAMSGSTTICPGSTASISIAFTGRAPWNFIVRNITAGTQQTFTTSTNPYIYTTPVLNATSVYKITAIKDSFTTATNFGCAAPTASLTSDSVKISIGAIAASLTGNNTICAGQSANLTFNLTGSPPWRIGYNAGGTSVVLNGVNTNPYVVSVSPSINTIYTIDSLRDNSGCRAIADSLTGTALVVVNPTSTASISGTVAICNGGTADLSVTLAGASPWNLTYTDGTTPVSVNNITTSPYTITVSPSVSSNYTLSAVTNSFGCNTPSSNLSGSGVVNVTPPSVGGLISGGSTVCAGSNTTALTLSGQLGNVIRWESSLDNFATAGTPIANTTTTLNVNNLSATTYYRAVVANGICAPVNSATAVINVSPNSFGGSISGTSAVCSGTNSGSLTLSGNTGDVVRWESSLDNFATAGTSISNTTNTLNFNNIAATTYFRAVVASGVCSSDNSVSATVRVGPTVTGDLTGTVSICENGSTNLTATLTGFSPWVITYNSNGANPASISNINNSPYNFSVSPSTSTTYSLVSVTDSLGCVATPANLSSNAVVTINVSSTTTWTGITADWFDGNNWCGGVPTASKDVLIPSGVSNMPVISTGGATVRNLTVEAAASLTIQSGGTLEQSGNAVIEGSFTNNGTFRLNGLGDQSFPGGSAGIISKMNILEVNKNSGNVTFNRKFAITDTGALRFTRAFIINVNDTITIRSNAIGTARIDSIVFPSVAINYNGTGCFSIERYIPSGIAHGKSWQLMSVPTYGQTVKQAWQEGAASVSSNPRPGYGTTITSNLAGATTSLGFDFFTPAGGTMKTYDVNTNNYVGISSTNIPIQNPLGYMLFVRGDRSVLSGVAPANPVTMRTTGKIFYGTGSDSALSVAVPAGKFQSVGNPYASAIDFFKVVGTSTGLNPTFYVWDPQLNSAAGLGAYQTISSFNGWQPVPGGTANYSATEAYSKIQSGQAFFVYSATGGRVKFSESNKVSGFKSVFRNVSINDKAMLKLNLQTLSGQLLDGNVFALDTSSSNSIDMNDAEKLNNFGENIGIRHPSRILAIDARYDLSDNDTIQYHLTNLKTQQYQLELKPFNLSGLSHQAILVDRYRNSQTILSLTAPTIYEFSGDNDARSKANDRFYIVFKKLRPLPVTFIAIQAEKIRNQSLVKWQVAQELGVASYDVERSANGLTFQKLATVIATGPHMQLHDYYCTDTMPLPGINYYRIRSVDLTGNFSYSKVVKVAFEPMKFDFSIVPNPVKDNQIRLSINGTINGRYQFKLYSMDGKLVYHTTVNLPSTSLRTVIIKPDFILSAGSYELRTIGPDGQFRTKECMVID